MVGVQPQTTKGDALKIVTRKRQLRGLLVGGQGVEP